MVTSAIVLLVFPALVAFAASSDLLTMTIPNRVALGLVAGFFVIAGIVGMSPANVAMHVGAGLMVLVLGFTCFSLGWIGGGDAKLAAATVLWLGFDQMLAYLLLASLFGGGLTLLLLQFREWPLPAVLNGQEWIRRLHERNAGIPYGIALSAAALLVYPESPFMRAVGI